MYEAYKNWIYSSLIFFFLLIAQPNELFAQFPPAAGQEESTAIAADNEDIIAWGTACEVTRGFRDIAEPDSGYVSSGEAIFGTGQADNITVSLGDGGQVMITFEQPIRNGEGWDFAVFENGFSDTFLELAFVEVSSDGENFVRFPATSLTDTITEIGTFGLLDATKINNLAGKYRLLQGTPFDLEELNDVADLDIEHITHVKLIDVVGSLDDNYASLDASGHKINDPYPTLFPQGGFDLDAIGIRYQSIADAIENVTFFDDLNIYPNPILMGETLKIEGFPLLSHKNIELELYQSNGFFIKKVNTNELKTADLERGLYFLKIVKNGVSKVYKVFIL